MQVGGWVGGWVGCTEEEGSLCGAVWPLLQNCANLCAQHSKPAKKN
jgi:hypothetical protein